MLAELAQEAERLAARRVERQRHLDLPAMLFGPQLAFVQDAAPFRTAVCSRRAGKSVGCAAALLDSALRRPGSISLYITLTRVNAKRILWRTLKRMNADEGLGGEPNEAELCIAFPNGSQVYLAGAKHRDEIEKYRGLPLGIVVLDEAQAFPPHIEELIDDVLEPALMDYDGSMVLIGTPAPVPVGYFYECSRNVEWSAHSWTVFQNPHIEAKSGKKPQEHLERALKRRGVDVTDPSIRREWFGEWVYDPNSLVFKFDAAKNVYRELPTCLKPWEHVIGVDLGWDDADAVSVIGFNAERPEAYQREEWVGSKQTISALSDRLAKLVAKYDPLAVVMDTGGLGKKIAEEIRQRTGLPIKAAQKTEKFSHIEILNDAMRTGRFFVLPESQFARDALLVEWDREKSRNDKLVVSDRFHSDIADAVLYAFRESLHWLHQPAPEEPELNTPAWFAREEERMRAQVEREVEEKRRELEGDPWMETEVGW